MLNGANHTLLEAKPGCSNAKTGVDTVYINGNSGLRGVTTVW